MHEVITPAKGAVLVLVLVAGFPLLAALPNQVGAIRLAGLSLLWWYGGLVAPVLAALVAAASASGGAPPPPANR